MPAPAFGAANPWTRQPNLSYQSRPALWTSLPRKLASAMLRWRRDLPRRLSASAPKRPSRRAGFIAGQVTS